LKPYRECLTLLAWNWNGRLEVEIEPGI
jgi:hypothetical protein